jgi:hypothetical protein
LSDPLVRDESPLEYFKTQVEAACQRQGVQAHPLTAYYVVNLLTAFTHLDRSATTMASNEPLGVKLVRALQSEGGANQRISLRQVGDLSLFISGFFADSLRRSLVDIDYYVALGGYAYGSLGRAGDHPLAETFEELSAKFVAFVDVLSEVSERSALTTNTDLLRLYEKWQRTGSPRNGELLVERGLVPNAAVRRVRTQ